MSWKIITRSAIGTLHQTINLPCQDYGDGLVLGEVVMGVVADGAGSAKYADVGAKLAVTTALNFLTQTEEWLQRQRHLSWDSLVQRPSEKMAQNLFTKVVEQVVTVLRQTADRNQWAIDDLACTLLAFIATPHWLAALQIGDGFIVVRAQDQAYRLLFQPHKGEYANQTTFVTSEAALADMQIQVLAEPQSFICAATDGLEKVAIRLSDWTAFPPFFQPLEEYLQETVDPNQEDDYLVAFLESDRLNQRTDDDKTLLLCLYDQSQAHVDSLTTHN
ncbi:PP2C family serine/threonine-protein phosphatase [Pantanalinema sp. GBBB05]|uniref:PP2C family serine/threonine-protein phosphatase n=1 Tax=Pantanalinema sp. GBBB05 TaxID=2604139 RepID=UPI001D78D11E|nr:protein phosphatase 2C domain-containing protein [Pantanalinema sp. GBBB05]